METAIRLGLFAFLRPSSVPRPSLRPHDLPALNRGGRRKPACKDAVDRQHFAEESREVGGAMCADCLNRRFEQPFRRECRSGAPAPRRAGGGKTESQGCKTWPACPCRCWNDGTAQRECFTLEKAVGTTKDTKDTKRQPVTVRSGCARQVRFFDLGKTRSQPLFSCVSCISWFISTAVFRFTPWELPGKWARPSRQNAPALRASRRGL